MLMLRHKERDEDVDVQKTEHVRRLRLVPVDETVDVLDGEDRRAWPRTEYRHAPVEAHIGLSHPSEQGFDELIDLLPSLACQIGEPGLQGRVQGDGGGWHL